MFLFILFFPTVLDIKSFKGIHLQQKCADGAGIFYQKNTNLKNQTQTKQKRKFTLK